MLATSKSVLLPAFAAVALILHGCGGGGGGGPSKPKSGPTSCSKELKGQHCSACEWASNGKDIQCTNCSGVYLFDNSTKLCRAECITNPDNTTQPPPAPDALTHEELTKYNGIKWPQMCLDKTQANFFGIGDWGGELPYPPKPFNNSKGRALNAIDVNAQMLVARMFNRLAATSKPDYVLNVGDNFYPGGILATCGQFESQGTNPACNNQAQFENIFEMVYNATELQGKPWLGSLGNHDYGGTNFQAGWDIQIYRTWCNETNTVPKRSNRWRTPAQYWSQKIQYADFAVDVFMLESNYEDAKAAGVDMGHNICGYGKTTPPCPALTNVSCSGYFAKLWSDSLKFLEEGMKTSTAEWQIVVTHFPAQGIALDPEFKRISQKYGIDLLFTGHQHAQVHGLEKDGGTPWIVSGGGGGISSDPGPQLDGQDDAYGFVDFQINRTHLRYDMHSHGGLEGKVIIRATELLTPRGWSGDVSTKVVV